MQHAFTTPISHISDACVGSWWMAHHTLTTQAQRLVENEQVCVPVSID